jgi:hypothetical protein
MKALVAVAVLTMCSSRLDISGCIKLPRTVIEALHCGVHPTFPVLALVTDEEVTAAHMADKSRYRLHASLRMDAASFSISSPFQYPYWS